MKAFAVCLTLFSLMALSSSITLTHEYSYSIWAFINGRKMILSPCFTVIKTADNKDIFTWQPKNLHIAGPCGTGNCPFTLNGYNFTLGTCTGNLTAPCTGYINRIKTATRITLVSNLINFFKGSSKAPVFVLENLL